MSTSAERDDPSSGRSGPPVSSYVIASSGAFIAVLTFAVLCAVAGAVAGVSMAARASTGPQWLLTILALGVGPLLLVGLEYERQHLDDDDDDD